MKRVVTVSLLLLAACSAPKNPPSSKPVHRGQPVPEPVPDAGPPAPAGPDPAELARRAALVDKCRQAVWATKVEPQAAIDACAAALRDAPGPMVKVMAARADTFRAAALLERKREDDAKECTAQTRQPHPDLAPCQRWFDASCATLPEADLRPPIGKRFKAKGKLGKKDWRPADPRVALMLSSNPALTCARNEPGGDVFMFKPNDPVPEAWFRSWYETDDALTALLNYHADGAGRLTEGVRSNLELATRLAQMETLERKSKDELSAGRSKESLETLDQALALDSRIISGPGDGGVPVPLPVINGGHLTRLQNLRDSAARAQAITEANNGNPVHACKLWWSRHDLLGSGPQPLDQFCEAEANKRAPKAKSCAELDDLLAFARPGTAAAQTAQRKRSESRCP